MVDVTNSENIDRYMEDLLSKVDVLIAELFGST